MAVLNQYKGIFKINGTLETESICVNATSMGNAIKMLTLEKGKEPIYVSLNVENILTEYTEETFVDVYTKSVSIDEESGEETLLSDCKIYPVTLLETKRGNSIYFSAPNYDGEERTYSFNRWILPNGEESTENPLFAIIPLDESIVDLTYKAVYDVIEHNDEGASE